MSTGITGRALAELVWRVVPETREMPPRMAFLRATTLAEAPDADRAPAVERAFSQRWREMQQEGRP